MKRWRVPFFLSGILLLSQAFSFSSPVRDPETLASIPGFQLKLPFWHVVFTPFSSVADYLTVLSFNQILFALLVLLLAVFMGFQNWKTRFFGLLGLLTFLAWGTLASRPMGKLMAENPNDLVLDFHSHTRYSHDGRPSFTPEQNMKWHQAQGYSAGFITDHNRLEGALEANYLSGLPGHEGGYRALRGEEISLHNTHLIVLGVSTRIDNKPYDGDPQKVETFIKEMRKKGYLVIASLPEYWEHHWKQGVDKFVQWGISGFEIISSAPKALEFPWSLRREVIALARKNNLVITGISDSHGYGSATAAWSVLTLPNWSKMSADLLEEAVISHLKSEGFGSVRVLERQKSYWRMLQPWQCLSWMVWIWGISFLRIRFCHEQN